MKKLNLSNNEISELSPLAELPDLKTLFLVNNDISDLSPLTTMTGLRQLWLDENPITDIAPLANLSNLEILSLDSNWVHDISPLAELSNLERLSLTDNVLDTTAGSTTATIEALQAEGTVVQYGGQRRPFPHDISLEDGRVELNLRGEWGTTWAIEVSDDLKEWEPVTTLVMPRSGQRVFRESFSPERNARFYRIERVFDSKAPGGVGEVTENGLIK